MRLVTTAHLKTWASTKVAESEFPYLIKNLICAVTKPDKYRFPSHEATWLPGYDGELACNDKVQFVPEGYSAWEVGTGKSIWQKADGDYNKRTHGVSKASEKSDADKEYDHSSTTFVFATPLVWKDKEKWVDGKKQDGIWKDIKVFDGVDLVAWLEEAPSVQLNLAYKLGLVPAEGLDTPEHAWEEWRYRTDPPASEGLVVVGREQQEQELLDRLTSVPSMFIIRGDSPQEAWGFALAVIYRISSEDERLKITSRVIVVNNETIAQRLTNIENSIILLKSTYGQVSGNLIEKNNHVIIPEGNNASSDRNLIRLTRCTHNSFKEELYKIGITEDEAEKIARECGRSITIFQRQQAKANYERPAWSDDSNVSDLLPPLLVGRWLNTNEEDQKVICNLYGSEDYNEIFAKLQTFLFINEPPLQKIGDVWALTAPVDLFQLTARHLTPNMLERFKIEFKNVFGKIDPQVEIPPDERFYYGLRKETGHSDWLRSGMAESLLLIAERGKDANLVCVSSPRKYAENIVDEIPGLDDDWRVLASIRDQFSRLLEAAPDPLFDKLEKLINDRPKDIQRLFEEGELLFGGGPMHTGLLWGLETLAWINSYFFRAIFILAKLARLDPGGKLGNRPIESLREIFLWWHPGTHAGIEDKLLALDTICENEPEICWALLKRLLPTDHSTSSPTPKPLWRDIGELPKNVMTRSGQIYYLAEIINKAFDRVGNDPDKWDTILNTMGSMDSKQQNRAIQLLKGISEDSTTNKIQTWEVLRNFIHNNRTYQDAEWSLPETILSQLDSILQSVEPKDPIQRYQWLFDSWFPELPYFTEDHEIQEQEIVKLRKEAIAEIFKLLGNRGIIQIGISCKLSGYVAEYAVPLYSNVDEVGNLLEESIQCGEDGVYFSAHISSHAFSLFERQWRDFITNLIERKSLSDKTIAFIILYWPDTRSTWDDAKYFGEKVEYQYWRHKVVNFLKGSENDVEYQINQLIAVNRAAEAFDRYIMRPTNISSLFLLKLFDATMQQVYEARTKDEVRRLGVNYYDMEKYLEVLRKRNDIEFEEKIRREYHALPILGSMHSKGLLIHRHIVQNPAFFLDIICDAFLPEGRNKKEEIEPTIEEENRAHFAYQILNGIEILPGFIDEDQPNETLLMEWIRESIKIAKKMDRLTVTEQKIGAILANSPNDPTDGGWPHSIVRNVIEELNNQNINRGLEIQRYNLRGVVTKHPYEGGEQEREIANQYQDWADIAKIRWPMVSRLLSSIADHYHADSQREDDRAEQRKLT